MLRRDLFPLPRPLAFLSLVLVPGTRAEQFPARQLACLALQYSTYPVTPGLPPHRRTSTAAPMEVVPNVPRWVTILAGHQRGPVLAAGIVPLPAAQRETLTQLLLRRLFHSLGSVFSRNHRKQQF